MLKAMVENPSVGEEGREGRVHTVGSQRTGRLLHLPGQAVQRCRLGMGAGLGACNESRAVHDSDRQE